MAPPLAFHALMVQHPLRIRPAVYALLAMRLIMTTAIPLVILARRAQIAVLQGLNTRASKLYLDFGQ